MTIYYSIATSGVSTAAARLLINHSRPVGTQITRTMASRTLTVDTINPRIKTMEYAVRGPIVIRALEIEKDLKNGVKKPFDSVIKANIGDAHAMGAKPITFIRQVMACVSDPSLIDTANYPSDVKQRARDLLGACGGGSIGAYTNSTGIDLIRQHAAAYIEQRDGGIKSDFESICLSGGASESIRSLLKMFVKPAGQGKPNGAMLPIPQYPLYSASTEEMSIYQIGYYLDEPNCWSLSKKELERSLTESQAHCDPKLIVVINPGNPTGQVLSRENIETIIKFAHANKLFLFADEVYQENVYAAGCAFHSFKKVLFEMGSPYKDEVELASFMSTSKGYVGECGQRGGYVEFVNLDPAVYALFKKALSAKLCSTVMGQVVMDCVVKPPAKGEPSYELWAKERHDILATLAERAKLIETTFNSMNGFKCNPVQGAMYAFPQITIPEKAQAKAKELGQLPDFFYALQLLEATGICVVPGNGFGQLPNTWHFRTTILPQTPALKAMLSRFKEFHEKFTKEYS